MRYEITDDVRHESYGISGECVEFEFPAGVVDASDEDAALIEKYLVPAGLAAAVAAIDNDSNDSNADDADASGE